MWSSYYSSPEARRYSDYTGGIDARRYAYPYSGQDYLAARDRSTTSAILAQRELESQSRSTYQQGVLDTRVTHDILDVFDKAAGCPPGDVTGVAPMAILVPTLRAQASKDKRMLSLVTMLEKRQFEGPAMTRPEFNKYVDTWRTARHAATPTDTVSRHPPLTFTVATRLIPLSHRAGARRGQPLGCQTLRQRPGSIV